MGQHECRNGGQCHVVTGCGDIGGEGEGEGEGHPVVAETVVTENAQQIALANGGEGGGEGHSKAHGEGEGEGEGGGAASQVDLATDDLTYLTQLGLMRGHLLVGNALYQGGHIEHAKTHMKHPESELYADIEPALNSCQGSGFAAELQALAGAVETEQGDQAVAEAYAAIEAAIASHEALVAEASNTLAAKLALVVALLRVAGDEYGIAVVDGKMENAHEYQDAYGFTRIAKTIVSDTTTDDAATSVVLEKAAAVLDGLDTLWPGIIPPETLETEAGQLYGAAAQIQLLALGLE